MFQGVGALLKENRINLNGLEIIYGVEKNKKQSSSRQILLLKCSHTRGIRVLIPVVKFRCSSPNKRKINMEDIKTT